MTLTRNAPADQAVVSGSDSVIRSVTLRVLETSVYRGPHLYSHIPMIRIQADLGRLEQSPSDSLPGFADRLMSVLPGLVEHGCSYESRGGFERRLREGTWLGHVAEHVALELQTLAGSPVSRGKTRSVKGRPGVYNILYAYKDEALGRFAGAAALRLIESLLPEELRGFQGLDRLDRELAGAARFEFDTVKARLSRLARAAALGPSTQALVDEARRRGIPVTRLDEYSLVQLGQGSRQKRFRASITSQTAHIAVETVGNKALTKSLLLQAGLPAPHGALVRTADEAVSAASRLKPPLVTKPLDGNHGRGVNLGLATPEQVRWGFEQAIRHGRRVVVEEMAAGRDYRILVVDGEVVAVAERTPAVVMGDGARTIAELIEAANQDPRRGDGHERAMTRIKVDDHVREMLSRAEVSLDSVPESGREIQLCATANLSTGGSAIDRTDEIHPDNAEIMRQAVAVVGLDVAGVDLVTPDISLPIRETGGAIVEINAAPGLRMHLQPSEGRPRDVARPIIASLFPPGRSGRIPVFAITGTNGKSTTGRMVAAILEQAGLRVGLTNTSGVYIGGRQVVARDASGPKSARLVLGNPTVDCAVLEVARGGILREGLGFDACDVGAVLNVTADHLGLKGVDTIEDLAAVKSVVVESVARRGSSVLNADDPMTMRMARHARGRVVYFTARGEPDMANHLRAHIARGGMAVAAEAGPAGEEIALYKGGERIRVMAVAEIPATLAGAARFNVQNAAAAIAITASHGVEMAYIRHALAAFTSNFEQNPGRMNLYDGHPFRVIMDYGHNPAALAAVADLVERLRPADGCTIGMVSIPGDRRDEDIRTMGAIASRAFDRIVFREAPDSRGRARGEVNRLMGEGALAAGADPRHIRQVIAEEDAVRAALDLARPGDLVVLLPTQVEAVWRQMLEFRPSFGPGEVVREGPARVTLHAG